MSSASGVRHVTIKIDQMARLEQLLTQLDPALLPRHVAMIMDGNGRWARMRGKERGEGHAEGISTVRRVTELSSDLGIQYLTLYAFSTENWNRPKEEVDTLMYLIGWAIERELPDLIRNNVKIHLIGDIDRIPEEARAKLTGSRDKTAHCTGLNLGICLSYSGRWEITQAARRLARMATDGNLDPEDITEDMIAERLATYPFPDPDLLIRTGGEERISNFLLWQVAYSELYFTKHLWPDFGKEEYAEALIEFQRRERRFGKTSEQIHHG